MYPIYQTLIYLEFCNQFQQEELLSSGCQGANYFGPFKYQTRLLFRSPLYPNTSGGRGTFSTYLKFRIFDVTVLKRDEICKCRSVVSIPSFVSSSQITCQRHLEKTKEKNSIRKNGRKITCVWIEVVLGINVYLFVCFQRTYEHN